MFIVTGLTFEGEMSTTAIEPKWKHGPISVPRLVYVMSHLS